MKFQKTLLACICGIAGAGVASHLVAAEQSAPAQARPKGAAAYLLEEVQVTARRKSNTEAAQDVPVAISAFSSDQLEAVFAENLTDIGLMAPNVTLDPVGTVPGSASFFVRGMGVNSSVPSDDPAVGVLVDGMFLGVNNGTMTDTFDLESVEILRGPQGTLFGRNVTGGAVLLRSKRPSGEFGFKVKGTLGSESRKDLSVAVEAPLVEDKLAGKIAVLSKKHDGYFDNNAVNGDDIGDDESLIVRPILSWTPSDDFTLTLIGEYGDQDSDGAPTQLITDKVGLSSGPVSSKFDLSHDLEAASELEWKHLIAEAEWALGSGEIAVTATWREIDQSVTADVDGSDAILLHFVDGTGIEQDQHSLEITYAGELTETVDLTTGLYYFTQDVDYREARELLGAALQVAGNGRLDHWTAGAFVQSDIHLHPEWTLTLGGRYTTETKEAEIASLGECSMDFSACTYSFNDEESWSSFTPKAGLRWTPSEYMQLYTSWTKGFRSGGFNLRNGGASIPAGPYDEEEVQAFEAGMKWDFWDGKARLNLAAFHNEFQGLQRTVLDDQSRQRILNAADAVVQGVEVDMLLLATENLAITASVGYTDASFDSFDALDLDGDSVADPDLAKGLDLVRVPEWTRYLSATYDLPLRDAGNLTFRASYSYTDKRAGNDANTFFLDAYELYDASVTFTDSSDHFKVSLFGKNLTNELYAGVGVDVSLFLSQYIAPPRTWGVEVSYEY
jgi:outer membrane receptor protein involved in Fe transport